jgi:hypothetical protein
MIGRAQKTPPEVRTIFLGDSVARQLLMPGTEPRSDVRFLTANQAISLAGQCRLLEMAFDADPAIRDVYLVYIPGCFDNNLSPRFSHDYYCGYFHRPRDVLEVFRLKHDAHLTASHVGRLLMPNLMLANSCWNAGNAGSNGRAAPTAAMGAIRPAPPEPEPILSVMDWMMGKSPELPEPRAGSYGKDLPPVSLHFFEKMKSLCYSHGAQLHLIPSPLSSAERFSDPQNLYEVQPMRVNSSMLMDAVHLAPSHVEATRRRMIAAYHLPLNPDSQNQQSRR